MGNIYLNIRRNSIESETRGRERILSKKEIENDPREETKPFPNETYKRYKMNTTVVGIKTTTKTPRAKQQARE